MFTVRDDPTLWNLTFVALKACLCPQTFQSNLQRSHLSEPAFIPKLSMEYEMSNAGSQISSRKVWHVVQSLGGLEALSVGRTFGLIEDSTELAESLSIIKFQSFPSYEFSVMHD